MFYTKKINTELLLKVNQHQPGYVNNDPWYTISLLITSSVVLIGIIAARYIIDGSFLEV